MRLFEHEDFEQLILSAAEHLGSVGLTPGAIEKDYFVTEALRLLATAYNSKVIFKGGTSRSKGWGLIQRFSEDIDIFLDPEAFTPKLGKRPIDRELARLKEVVDAHPGLTFVPEESKRFGGIGRNDYFSYFQLFPGALRNRVLVEVGTGSGRQPTELIALESMPPVSSGRPGSRSVQRMSPLSQCHSSTSAEPSSKSSSPFTGRSNSISRTASRSAPMPGITTISTCSLNAQKYQQCCVRKSTSSYASITIG